MDFRRFRVKEWDQLQKQFGNLRDVRMEVYKIPVGDVLPSNFEERRSGFVDSDKDDETIIMKFVEHSLIPSLKQYRKDLDEDFDIFDAEGNA